MGYWLFDGKVKQSLLIHFNTKNQSVGRIKGKHCFGAVIGPNKEVLVGFDIQSRNYKMLYVNLVFSSNLLFIH